MHLHIHIHIHMHLHIHIHIHLHLHIHIHIHLHTTYIYICVFSEHAQNAARVLFRETSQQKYHLTSHSDQFIASLLVAFGGSDAQRNGDATSALGFSLGTGDVLRCSGQLRGGTAQATWDQMLTVWSCLK